MPEGTTSARIYSFIKPNQTEESANDVKNETTLRAIWKIRYDSKWVQLLKSGKNLKKQPDQLLNCLFRQISKENRKSSQARGWLGRRHIVVRCWLLQKKIEFRYFKMEATFLLRPKNDSEMDVTHDIQGLESISKFSIWE